MTSPLQDMLGAFAMRKKVRLAPDWAANAPHDVAPDDAGAVEAFAAALGWPVRTIRSRPRPQQFPLLVWDDSAGWCIAEQWLNDKAIRALSAVGPIEIEWTKGLPVVDLDIPRPARPAEGKALLIFWSAILKRKSMLIDAGIATLIVNVIALVTSLYSMQVYDRVIPRSGYATLFVLTAGTVFAILVDTVIRYTRAMLLDRESGAIDGEVSELFYARMQAVRLDARPKSIGTMAAQLRGTEQIRSFLSSASLFVLADLPFALFFIVVMSWLGGIVALVPLSFFPISVLLALFAGKFILKDTAAAQVTGNRKNGLLVEALDAAETVKANSGGWHMIANWNRLVDEVHRHDLKVRKWSTLSSSGFGLIQQLSYIAVIFVGAYEVSGGHMTMGAVVACSILSGRVNGPLVAALPGLIVQWGYARSSLAALDAILDLPSDQPVDREPIRHQLPRGELQVADAKFVYEGARSGVAVGKFAVSPGERVGIIGPVGSGKSTLLRLLAGLYAPKEGHVFLDGIDVRQMAEEDLRRHICYFPQEYRLITGSLRDNLTLGTPNPTDAAIMEAAANTGLIQLIQSHPMGLDLPISEGGYGLSGGQRTLVGLTRVLLAKPRLLLLDEPTANLDQDTELRVLQAILQAALPETTILIVTHKMQLLSLVRRLVVVVNGQVALDGPTKEVLDKLRPPPAGPQGQPPKPAVVTEGAA